MSPQKNRITLSQIMAILALIGILLSVVGTAWISQQPVSNTSPESVVSGEAAVPVPLEPIVQK